MLAVSVALLPIFSPLAQAQFKAQFTPAAATEASLSLPDSPGTVRSNEEVNSSSSMDGAPAELAEPFGSKDQIHDQNSRKSAAPLPMASHVQKYIEPGQPVPRLIIGDKILMGFRDTASLFAVSGWVASSAYSQFINSTPNYGRNGKAYAQRLGAAAARSSSEGIFSDAIMSSVLHTDPRYYRMGNAHGVPRRFIYAVTRTVFTRTDNGNPTINIALLSGNLAGAALTQAYYPPQNRGFGETMKTFGTSIGGSAVGFTVSEFFTGFLDGALEAVHLKKSE